jgi:NitT/TauT family transport system substrate-binding protein
MKRYKPLLLLATMALLVSACGGSGDDAGSAAGGGSKRIKIGIESPWSVPYLTTAVAIDRMKTKGYTVEPVLFDSPETMTQALASKQIDVGSTSVGSIFAAIDAGLPAKAFLGLNQNNFVMVAKSAYTTCQSLDGKRIGIHSQEGSTGTMTRAWLKQECPGAHPKILVVPGSENRIAGLIANQLDASPVDIQSATQLQKRKPGEFTIIESFGQMDIVASMFFARTDWLQANHQLVQEFVNAYVAVTDEANKDPNVVTAKARELIPEVDQQTLQDVLKEWVARKIWDPVGTLDDSAVASTLDFYRQQTQYKNIHAPADVVDRSFVQQAS